MTRALGENANSSERGTVGVDSVNTAFQGFNAQDQEDAQYEQWKARHKEIHHFTAGAFLNGYTRRLTRGSWKDVGF